MTLPTAMIINVVACFALLGGLAFVMSLPCLLTPHAQEGESTHRSERREPRTSSPVNMNPALIPLRPAHDSV